MGLHCLVTTVSDAMSVEPKHDMTGRFARKINDYVPYIPEISDERALMLLENQIDDLKREVLFWKAKANDS